MTNQNSSVQYLELKDYQTKPWKNGKGQTHDILIMPKDADHSNFDLRFALSPIVEAAAFSSFPGADRVITVIEGPRLDLTFDTSTEQLTRFDSLRFDTGLAPFGDPVDGPVRVVNVMARRGVWNISFCDLVSHKEIRSASDEIVFLFAVDDAVSISGSEGVHQLEPLASAIISGPAEIAVDAANFGKVLYAHLQYVQS
ncbi:MAG: HutD family protein [Pseudomonadota bacterium]